MKWVDRSILALWAVTTPMMAVAIWMTFVYAPTEKVMGPPQRIFYFHVPAAIMTFLAVFVMLVASIIYLRTRKLAWDNLSRAATESGVMLCTIVLTTGPLWARPAWGVWWTWEAKITTTLILWLLLVGCLLVRSYSDNREQAARLGAILGIFAAVDVPIIHKATVWWRGQHPVVFAPDQGGSLAPKMASTFGFCMLTFLFLLALLVLLRFRAAQVEDRAESLVERLAEATGDV